MFSARGHVYPLLLVRLALTWACSAGSSYRGLALIFSSLEGLVWAEGPCAETIRLWLLRVGLFLLQRSMPRLKDWVFLVDLTIQLGQHKCLVVLGVPLSLLAQKGYSPDHHDVVVLCVTVLTRCDGETVKKLLVEVSERVGLPLQIVCDHGSDVRPGVRRFCGKQVDRRQVVETYDITHGLAILLKHRLEPDWRWDSFVKACHSTRQQLQQTAGSFLQPPAWRNKARFLNLDSHLKWANDMLVLLQGGGCAALAEQLGQEMAFAATWLEEKLGWLRGYAGEVRTWSYFQKVVKVALEEVKQGGLSRTSWQRVKSRLAEKTQPEGVEAAFRRQVVSFVRKEGAKVPARQKYLGSSDVLESLFGKYKDLADQAPCREITANVLTIPLLVTPLTADLLREALESVRAEDVQLWLDQHLGLSPQKKKHVVLAAARSKCPE